MSEKIDEKSKPISSPPLILVMGVSSCGKTTVAKKLSEALHIPFIEADSFHPISNIEKMKSGQPLNDEDRQPWLENLAVALKAHEATGATLACSALKESYRTTLQSLLSKPLHIVFLKGSFELIKERIEQRANHFMPTKLLQSQFDTLEEPQDAWTFDVVLSVENIVSQILEKTKSTPHHG